jgi:type VI secretion system secreted protein VgrG
MDGRPAENVPYELIREDGTVLADKTTASGSTGLQKSSAIDSYTIRWRGELP